MTTVLDHRVRENTGSEAEVSAETHCRAQVQLKQFPVHEHLAPQRRFPLLCLFLTGNLSDGAQGLLYVVPTSRPCKALLPKSATRLCSSTAQ